MSLGGSVCGSLNVWVDLISYFDFRALQVCADGFLWLFLGFYEEPSIEKKRLSWKALHTLNAARQHPWLYCGDFNKILLECGKDGGLQGHRCAWIVSRRCWKIVIWWILGLKGTHTLGGIIVTHVMATFVRGSTEQWHVGSRQQGSISTK
jgi:hypothetical protein